VPGTRPAVSSRSPGALPPCWRRRSRPCRG
jgi:hypothetical protein